MQLVNLVELIFYPGPAWFTAAEPHIRHFGRVQVVSIQSGTVDGVFRAHILSARTGSCGDDILDLISKQLGLKTPDFTFMYRGVRRGIDLINPPVVSRVEIEAFGWGIAAGTLGNTTNAVVDVVKVLTNVNSVSIGWRGENSRLPVKDNIS